MGSISARLMREKYSGRTDEEVAAAMARESGDLVIVRYKSPPDAADVDNFAFTPTSRELNGYLTSSDCHSLEILFDDRAAALPREEPLQDKTVSLILYRLGSRSAPPDRPEYCMRTVSKNYRGSVRLNDTRICIGTAVAWDREWALEWAVYDYRRMVRAGDLPDLGSVADLFQGTGPDGTREVGLLFVRR
jgi:hypothetical protein